MKRLTALLMVILGGVAAAAQPAATYSRVVEWTFESRKTYPDPFDDVDVNVIFSKDGASWRVPTFWRGGNKWTVRFAPPSPGAYTYRLESTDSSNPDLNGHEGRVTITGYTGTNELLRHGPLRVSSNKRYFEHADGTPFYWLGDTWWTGMSDRLRWEDYQTLTADRKAKGFTVVQIVAGLVPFDPSRQQAPSDPDFCNEGGCVWQPGFARINPVFFEYADRRVQHLVDSGIVPAIVGAWGHVLPQMGVAKMKKHWRYIIARYGAYPVFWIVGGEVLDPPKEVVDRLGWVLSPTPGWTDVARYVREVDPYHHPLTAHEGVPWWSHDYVLQDESLLDFNLLQHDHAGWPSIANEVAQLNLHRARTSVAKPSVVGEIGYETLGAAHLEDFQRVAFWLAMLNGAAGHTYGAGPTFVAYSADNTFSHLSSLTWEEGMNLPGSYQIGLGAKLLRQYPWWRFEPHPEWVAGDVDPKVRPPGTVVPRQRGTTLLEPRSEIRGFNVMEEWKAKDGDFYYPYAAGVPGEVRFIYMPYFTWYNSGTPTVLGLEEGVRYHAYFWEPSLGFKIDLGSVERPSPGFRILEEKFDEEGTTSWVNHGAKPVHSGGRMYGSGEILAVINSITEADLVASVDARSDAGAGLLFRFQNPDNYVVGVYSARERAIYFLDRKNGRDGSPLGRTTVPKFSSDILLTAEVRGPWAAISITDRNLTYTTPIVRVSQTSAGATGLRHWGDGTTQSFDNFVLRRSSTLVSDEYLERRLYDARGVYRGELRGPGWDDFGKDKIILLDAYRPEKLPIPQDWVLVLERMR